MALARDLAKKEGARRAAGRLFNAGALLLAEQEDVTSDELYARLQCAFMRFDINELEPARH